MAAYTKMSVTASSPSRTRSGLANLQDKGAVVLDIGRVYTKCGMSGEAAPRHIIRSQVTMKPYGELMDVWNPKYLNKDELYLILCRFMSDVYLKYLMANPRDHRVVIVESILSPTNFRNTLARVLFSHFGVPHICFLPLHLSCLFTLGRLTALVVDMGFKETSALPVYEGMPVMKAWQVTDCATTEIHRSLKELLLERATVVVMETQETKPLAAIAKDLDVDSILEDVVVRSCFVHSKESEREAPNVTYPLGSSHQLCVDGYIRTHATDCLFQSWSVDATLPVCILDALLQCSLDCRRQLSENIVLVGGTATLTGLSWRLKQELCSLIETRSNRYGCLSALDFKFHSPPSHACSTAWLGGSLLGACESAVLQRSVSREEYRETRSLPDWMSCDQEQQERLKEVVVGKLLSATSSTHGMRKFPSFVRDTSGSKLDQM